jgi:hypothetical protein
MGFGRWAYALENGNVGVYKKKTRLWRIKSKLKAISLINMEMKKKPNYLIIGW